MPVADLGNTWERHSAVGSAATEAFLVSHGSYADKGFTDLETPSDIHFYTFHGHSIYTVEMEQVIDYQARVAFSDGIVACKRKIATSIMGAHGKCWNYDLFPWDQTHYDRFIMKWGGNAAKDLIIMKPKTGGLMESVFGGTESSMNQVLQGLATAGLAYTTIHFLCCRSTSDTPEKPRAEPPSTRPLYKASNPYWPAI